MVLLFSSNCLDFVSLLVFGEPVVVEQAPFDLSTLVFGCCFVEAKLEILGPESFELGSLLDCKSNPGVGILKECLSELMMLVKADLKQIENLKSQTLLTHQN